VKLVYIGETIGRRSEKNGYLVLQTYLQKTTGKRQEGKGGRGGQGRMKISKKQNQEEEKRWRKWPLRGTFSIKGNKKNTYFGKSGMEACSTYPIISLSSDPPKKKKA